MAAMERLSLSRLGTSDDPSQILAHVDASSACLPVTVLPIPGNAERDNDVHANARIFVAHQGRGRRWYQQCGRTVPLRTEPRMIEIYEKGLVFDHCKWEGEAGRCVLIEFPDHDVQALTHGEVQSVALRTHQELFDDRISGLALDIARKPFRASRTVTSTSKVFASRSWVCWPADTPRTRRCPRPWSRRWGPSSGSGSST